MSIIVTLNSKPQTIKPTQTFGDLFDYSNEKGKFTEFDFYINNEPIPNITKAKKLQDLSIQPGANITMIKKGTQPPSQIIQPPTQNIQPSPPPQPQFPIPKPGGFPFNPNSNSFPKPNAFTPGQPTGPIQPSTYIVSPSPTPSKPVVPEISSRRKVLQYLPLITESHKVVNEYNVKIKDQGMTVELWHESEEFKAIFKEENAQESNYDAIKTCLTPTACESDPATVSKVVVGQDGSSTKVLFLKGFTGLAISWATGLLTYFQFWIEK